MSIKTVENMVNWIEDNITMDPTLGDMSRYVGYSQFYCSKKFHEHVGITFKQYIAKRRLSLAAMEVRNTQHRLLDIALKYGFSSPESFARAFVSTYGYTPSQYRKLATDTGLYAESPMLPLQNN